MLVQLHENIITISIITILGKLKRDFGGDLCLENITDWKNSFSYSVI